MTRALDDDPFDVIVDEFTLVDQELPAGFLAAQYEHRHGQPGLSKVGEVFAILLERAEYFESRSHAARLRIRLGIELPVLLRHGVLRIGGEFIPEVLEVSAFAALYQC